MTKAGERDVHQLVAERHLAVSLRQRVGLDQHDVSFGVGQGHRPRRWALTRNGQRLVLLAAKAEANLGDVWPVATHRAGDLVAHGLDLPREEPRRPGGPLGVHDGEAGSPQRLGLERRGLKARTRRDREEHRQRRAEEHHSSRDKREQPRGIHSPKEQPLSYRDVAPSSRGTRRRLFRARLCSGRSSSRRGTAAFRAVPAAASGRSPRCISRIAPRCPLRSSRAPPPTRPARPSLPPSRASVILFVPEGLFWPHPSSIASMRHVASTHSWSAHLQTPRLVARSG